MELYDDNGRYFIEWDIPGMETTEYIGIEREDMVLTGYDGVFEIPVEAIELLRENGFTVPKEFEQEVA